MKKIKKFINRTLMFFKGIKPIHLTETDIKWIKMCKLHYMFGSTTPDGNKYEYKGQWTETLKPLFKEIYGWDPDDEKNYNAYLQCVFNKLLEAYLKIEFDQSGGNRLKSIFNATFYRSFSRNQDLPIERAIAELCGLIQGNIILYGKITRYYL